MDTNMMNIDLSVIEKKKFTIDGDPNRVLELDVSDMNVVVRLNESVSRLNALQEKATKLCESLTRLSEEEGALSETATMLKEVDGEMRDIVDYIFDSNVSEVCVPSGTMYDPFNGKSRYEHIVSILSNLYSDNISKEAEKINNRISKHTKKYSGK